MTHLQTVFVPQALVGFTSEEVDILMRCCSRHYDRECKSAGRPGGLVWGIKNTLELGGDVTQITRTEINLLRKILEMGILAGSPIRIAYDLTTALRSLWNVLLKDNPPAKEYNTL